MNSKLQIFWTIMAAVSCSFLQTPNKFHSTFNSTFLTENERLFKPIFIPNITNNSEYPQKTKARLYETHKTNENEAVLKKILQPQEIPQESTIRENYSEDSKTTGNPLKFSSRYSTKDEDSSKEVKMSEKLAEVEDSSRTTDTSDSLAKSKIEIISSKSEEIPIEERKSFSDRSDELGDSEEEQTGSYRSSDSDEQKDEDSGEIPPGTDETYPEIQKSNSFRKYSDFENFETTPTSVENDDSEENEKEEEENKRSVGDYYNLGSKNYHSIQTPLKEIKYRGPHSYGDDFESEKVRTRFSPIRRRPVAPHWPQMKSELEKLNEISDSDENYEKKLDEGVKEEVKIKPKQKDLELAVEKDETKFDRNKKYNFVEERNRRKQQQKNLAAEENKDNSRPLFQSLRQYQVDEKEPNYQPEVNAKEGPISKFNINEGRTTRRPPKNIFNVRTPKRKQPKKFNISDELSHNFQGHQFLGPIIFKHDLQEETVKAKTKSQREPTRNIFLEDLSEKEKADQNNLSSGKFQKSTFGTGSLEIKSFNHLEESDEMYNAILANIQSVFGLRTHLGKSRPLSQKDSITKVNSDSMKSLTWPLPPIKREKVN